MNKRTEIILRVNEQAADFYDDAQKLGTLAAQTFLEERQESARQRHRAQLTGLENIAETTLKVTDVLDYIKKQTSRQKGWKEEHQGQRFGVALLDYLEENIKKNTEDICVKVNIASDAAEYRRDRQYIYLQLVRQFIRQLLVQYEYKVEQLKEEPRHAK